MSSLLFFTRGSVLALTCLPTLFVAAQSPDPDLGGPDPIPATANSRQLEPVSVRGQRPGGLYSGQSRDALGLDLADREVPQSVSVITATQIADFGLRNANAVLDHATGVTVERFESDRTYFTARGYDITNFQFDGVGLPFTNGNQLGDLDTAVFEQVDVLRGANGLLSATGNPSATVNFVRKRPTAFGRASAGLTLGSWRGRRLEVDVSGPLSTAAGVRGRVIAVRERTGSHLARYGVDKTVLSGLLDIDLGTSTRLSLGHLVQRNVATRTMWGGLPLVYTDGTPTDYPVSATTAPDWSFWNNTDRRTHAELTQGLGADWTLKAVALYRQLGYDSALFYVHGTPDRDTGLGLVGDAARSNSGSRQRMVDLRLSGPLQLFGREHQVLLGIDHGEEHTGANTDNALSIDLPTSDLVAWGGRQALPQYDGGTHTHADFRTQRLSLYGALHLKPTDRLGLVLGANLNRVDGSGENYSVVNGYHARVATPYAGAVYALSDRVSAYGSFTRIFNPQSQVGEDRRVLPPAQGSNLEAGLKTDWLDKRLLASFAVFRARQDHVAEYAGDLPDFQPYYRGVDTTVTGFEAEVSGRPLPGWELSGGYAQLRIRDAQGAAARNFIPRRSLHASTSYASPVLPALRLGASLRWQSETRTPVEEFTVVQKPYAVVDLMARYDLGSNAYLSVNLNNVANTRHLNSLYWQWTYYGAPRNLSVSLHGSF